MKKFLSIFLALAASVILAYAIYIAWFIYDKNHVDMGKLRWVVSEHNATYLTHSDAGVILGPCFISLWAKYPYIYGNYHLGANSKPVHFIIDMDKDTPVVREIDDAYYLHELQKLGLDFSSVTNYWSLKGQWGDKNKLQALQDSMKAN